MKHPLFLIIPLLALASCSSPTTTEAVETTEDSLVVNIVIPTEGITDHGGIYAWIEDSTGVYVDTIQQYFGINDSYQSGSRFTNDYCDLWQDASGETSTLVTDGVTGASLLSGDNGTTYTTAGWDLKDKDGAAVADGTYEINLLISYHNDTPSVYTYATGDIVLGSTASTADLTISYDQKASYDQTTTHITSAQAVFTPAD